MLNCHRLNSWICHRRITSNTIAKDCFHRPRTKVMGLKTITHCWSRCGSNFSGLVICFVGLCHLHFLAVACAKMDLLVKMHLMLCVLRLTTIPKMPGTMDQKDSNEGAEGAGSCAYACKAQASARVDKTLEYTNEHADDGSGMCKAGFASDNAKPCDFPFDWTRGGYNMPGIMFGMDQKDSNSSDEVQIKRCNVTAVADDASCLFRDIKIDPIMDEY